MNKEDKGIMRHIIVNIIILLLMTFLILILSRQENYARQLIQIKKYTNELSARTGKHVEDVFTDKRNAIEAIAYLYGKPRKQWRVPMPLKKTGRMLWMPA